MAGGIDRFFESIPNDSRYHIELRTPVYLSLPVFEGFDPFLSVLQSDYSGSASM